MLDRNKTIGNEYDPMCALDPLLLIPRFEYVEDILKVIESKSTGYTLVILDMKNFHLINDVYDYTTGDNVLARFISLLRTKLPRESFSLRFRHGDEFLFFLPTTEEIAGDIFKSFNHFCESFPFLTSPDGANFLISFRFATLGLSNTDYQKDNVLRIAEFKLREVKGKGTIRKN